MANVARIIVRFGIVDDTLLPNLLLHVKTVDSRHAIDDDDMAALAVATSDWWEVDGASYGAVQSAYPSDIKLNEVSISRVKPTVSSENIYPMGGAAGTFVNVGTLVRAVLLPPQVSYMIGLRTSLDTRRGRGRIYMPAVMQITSAGSGPPAANIALGLLGDANERIAHMASRIAEAYFYTPGVDPGTFVLCVYSAVDGVGRAVTHFAIPQHARTQRRRALHPSPLSNYGLDGVPA